MTNEELDRARIDEACRLVNDDKTKFLLGEVARLAREGWTPPVPVDPDLAEAEAIWFEGKSPVDLALAGIKRGRALAAAEAKPGLVWVKHDKSKVCPIDIHQPVLIININGFYAEAVAGTFQWHRVTHYAVITPPEDVA